MDMPQSPDWNLIRAFLATAQSGSLTAAAHRLGLTQPTIGRQVAAFEEALGVVLFDRVGRRLILTSAGQSLARHAAQMEAAAAQLGLAAAGFDDTLEGRLSISAGDMAALHVLPPFLADLRRIAPRLAVDILASNSLSDLRRREADIAIRHVRPHEPELIARHLRETEAGLYASPAYLAAHGVPDTIEALTDHSFVGIGDPQIAIGFLAERGIPLAARNFMSGSDDGVVAWQMVRAGLGLGFMDTAMAAHYPDVTRLSVPHPPLRFPVWAVTHRELHHSRRIRLVFDRLCAHIRRDWARLRPFSSEPGSHNSGP